MERGGSRRWGQGGVAIAVVALSLTLGLPSVPETRLALAPAPEPVFELPRHLLEAEPNYPNPLRTALELEGHYAAVQRADATALVPLEASGGVIALTFDTEIPRGGEAQQTVNEILDVLHRENVHATFFVVGTWARSNPDILRRIADEGHEIANHSFDHRAYARRSGADLRADLARVAETVERETGRPIAPLFRPPYGCTDSSAVRVVEEQGYALVGWTATGTDARGSTSSPVEVLAALAPDLQPGAVVLLHTNRWITAAALPRILDEARRRQLEPLTVSDMLQRRAVESEELSRRPSRSCGSLAATEHRPSRQRRG